MSSYIFVAILGFIGGIGIGRSIYMLVAWRQIDSLIQEIKQEPGVSVNQSTYAIKVLERLKERL